MESIQTIIKTLLRNPTLIKSKSEAKQIHAQIVKSFPIHTSSLLFIYSKLNLLPESLLLFNTLPTPPVLAWKSIIKCYSSNGYFLESLNCFVKMRGLGINHDHNVFPSVLKSCTHLMYFKFGKSVHACVIRVGLEFDIFIGNALLSMYSKVQRFSALEVFDESPGRMTADQNESIFVSDHNNNNFYHKVSEFDKNLGILNQISDQEETVDEIMRWKNKEGDVRMRSVRKVFETMPERDIVSYNTVILGYAQSNMYNEALMMIKEMGRANLKPDAFTLSNVLPIVAEYMDIWKGKEIHGYGVRHGFHRNEFIVSGLTDVYANCNMVEDSYRLFSSLSKKDSVSWCSIIAACVQNGLFDEGLRLFRQMLSVNIKPVPISFSSIIPACAHLTALPLGQQLHGYIIRGYFEDNMYIASSLVHMYARCGNIKLAMRIFDNMKQHDLVSWTAMMMEFALHGHAYDAISLFEQMEKEGFRPNSVAFVAVLTACSHAGMVNEGLKFFNKMVKQYKITPDFEHYACMADLLGRAGKLEEAFGFICSMPENKTASMWLPLLAACRVHKNVELAEKVSMQICEFDTENAGADLLLSDTYSSVGRYKDAANVRRMLSKIRKGLYKGLVRLQITVSPVRN
ncbi:Pentatricopeptide repeat-containing protein [Cynara cardunculus var. scolymus]|uniref:Pentatricopeptide repeat-containing protein n=1 Tax=Cynara cardunculus var. scolymus TaxID=59895 RepID=A0A103WY03_CYNCS|nr:Pentatricopeptide repeat-containing protein [Cynara cardunculus var. scolymus]